MLLQSKQLYQNFLNHLFSEMCLFTLHKFSTFLYFQLLVGRLFFPEFSGSHYECGSFCTKSFFILFIFSKFYFFLSAVYKRIFRRQWLNQRFTRTDTYSGTKQTQDIYLLWYKTNIGQIPSLVYKTSDRYLLKYRLNIYRTFTFSGL